MQYGACTSNVSGIWYCSVITNGVRKLAVIPAHNMTPIPSHSSCWRMQHWAWRSPGRRHTLWRPSWRYWQNLDSSENTTLFHCLWFQFRWRRAHWWRFWRRSDVRTLPMDGRCARILLAWSRLRTVVGLVRSWWFLDFQQLFARLSGIYFEGAATRYTGPDQGSSLFLHQDRVGCLHSSFPGIDVSDWWLSMENSPSETPLRGDVR